MIQNVIYVIFFLLEFLIRAIIIIGPVLIAVAYLTLAERKILAAMQKRQGPVTVGIAGMLQPFADGIKLIAKETVIPIATDRKTFILAPVITLSLAIGAWAVIPFVNNEVLVDINIGVLYTLAISSLSVYAILIAGWSTNSIYAFLGALRSAAQMISYEVSIGLILLNVLIVIGTLNLSEIVLAQQTIWFVIPFFPLFILFFVSALAETNRAPFDLPEAEGELVAGYNVEYSAGGFVLFFVGEYANMILMAFMITIIFLGGWLPIYGFSMIPATTWIAFKVVLCLFTFVWVRAAFPRYRYDQLMRLGWKVFLPLSFGCIIFIASLTYII
jgi:NADH-quinone oxidoreductase subunit H